MNFGSAFSLNIVRVEDVFRVHCLLGGVVVYSSFLVFLMP